MMKRGPTQSLVRTTIVGVTATLAAVTAARAELPSWSSTADQLYVIRHTWWLPYEESYSGLWSFDPDRASYRWLRPLHFNNQGEFWIPRDRTGEGAYLAGGDGRLVLQAWPYSFDFDLQGLRMLRRYPPIEDPNAFGWAVQGAFVPEATAASWGVERGFYGFPLCLLAVLSRGLESMPRRCGEYTFPGHHEPLLGWGGDTSVLLRRGAEADQGALNAVSEAEPFTWSTAYSTGVAVPPVLSLDNARRGLWFGTPRGAQFLPMEDGGFGPATAVTEFSFPPFDEPDVELNALFFHPRHETFYGVGNTGNETWFFTLDADLEPVRMYGESMPKEETPITFAAAGELPQHYQQLVPIIARTEGRNGTFWTSDLWLFNPSSEPTTVTIERLTRRGSKQTLHLPAHGSVRIDDVLTWAGGGDDGDGARHDALLVESPYRWGEQVVVVSRTHTPAGDSGGSYGQAVPSVPGAVGYSNHLPYPGSYPGAYYNVGEKGLRMSNLTPDRREPGRFRHNLGVVNTSERPLELTLVWGFAKPLEHDIEDYRPLAATQTVSVAPGTIHLVSLEELFPQEVRDVWPARVALFGERPAAVWISMVDNLTGDATFVPFSNYHWPTDTEEHTTHWRPDWKSFRVTLPVVTHAPGVNGTVWQTDVYGIQGNFIMPFGPWVYDRPPAWFHPSQPGSDCAGVAAGGDITTYLEGEIGVPLQSWMDWLAGGGEPPPEEYAKRAWRTVFPDVVRLFPECAGDTDVRGALEISAGAWVTGYSRTYTTRQDGGTLGGMLPFYPPGGWPVQHFAGIEVGPQLRVNVGLFNGKREHPVVHRLTLYACDGEVAAQTSVTLEPLASLQLPLHHIFSLGEDALARGTYSMTVLPLDDEEAGAEGRCWAYVSLVDNVTGDPTNWW